MRSASCNRISSSFSDSIERNITLGDPSISSEQVKRASEDVHLDRFVQKMPEVYGTEIKEDGAGLSVGQKQLVAFARAFSLGIRVSLSLMKRPQALTRKLNS